MWKFAGRSGRRSSLGFCSRWRPSGYRPGPVIFPYGVRVKRGELSTNARSICSVYLWPRCTIIVVGNVSHETQLHHKGRDQLCSFISYQAG